MGTLCGALVCRSRSKLELIGKTEPQVKATNRDRGTNTTFSGTLRVTSFTICKICNHSCNRTGHIFSKCSLHQLMVQECVASFYC